jgi:hypothetical protein
MSVDRGTTGFAISHASLLKHIQIILPLSKEEALGTLLDSHT